MDGKEIGNSFLKSIFAAVPYAGQPLNELFFEYRGRIKQNRLNDFTELIAAHFSNDKVLDFKSLNEVEFSDLFESVISRVVRTGSEEKHKRFRDILINYIEDITLPIDHAETFLDLVSSLNESAILILKYHDKYDHDFEQLDRKDAELKDSIAKENERVKKLKESSKSMSLWADEPTSETPRLTRQLQQVQEQIKKLAVYRQASFYKLTEDDFLYLKQILISKALLSEPGVGSIGHIPYFYMRITLFGKQFIRYIREGKHD